MKLNKELLQDAHNFFLEEKFEEAKKIFEDLLYQKNIEGADRLIAEFEYSWVLYRQQRYDEAIAILSRISKLKELAPAQQFDAMRLIGFSQIAKGNFSEAIDVLKDSDKIDIEDDEKKFMLFELGKSLFIEGRYPEALNYFNRITDAFDANDMYSHSIAFYEGFINLFLNNIEDALTKFTFLIENTANPELLASGLFGMANIYFKREQYEQLLKICDDIIQVYPEFYDKETLAYFTTKAYFKSEEWSKFTLFYEQLKLNFPDGKYKEEYAAFQEKFEKIKA